MGQFFLFHSENKNAKKIIFSLLIRTIIIAIFVQGTQDRNILCIVTTLNLDFICILTIATFGDIF